MERVSLLKVLTCWLCPATTAGQLSSVKLRYAYAIHFLAGLAFFFGFLLLIQIDMWTRGSSRTVFEDLAREFHHDWREATLITAIVVLSIELGFLGLAMIVLPWGAGDEPLRSSWARALRFTWLHTTHALPLLLAMGAIGIGLQEVKRSYYRANPWPEFSYPKAPARPANAVPGSQAMMDYQAAVKKHQEEMQRASETYEQRWHEYWRSRPFMVKHGDAILGWLGLAASVWILWALFRAVGARREPLPVARPPMCEFCGYNLTGTPMEGRCPECGTPVTKSLGPDVRPGTAWERGGGWGAWCRCGLNALFRPGHLGRHIQVTTQPRRYRLCWWPLFLWAFAVGTTAMLVGYVVTSHRNFMEDQPEIVTMGAPATGAASAAGLLAATLLVASAVGMIQTWRHGRNLLPAAGQMASYLSLALMPWSLLAGGWMVVLSEGVTDGSFWRWGMVTQIDDDLLALMFGAVPYLILLPLLAAPIWKGTSAARYANK